MQPIKPRLERPNARAWFAIVAILMFELAGCATTSNPGSPPKDVAPYVGAFTGSFVDGKPLYRFPTIEVVGTRSSAAPDT